MWSAIRSSLADFARQLLHVCLELHAERHLTLVESRGSRNISFWHPDSEAPNQTEDDQQNQRNARYAGNQSP